MTHLNQTERFRRAALLPVADVQSAPSYAERVLNLSLLLEELAELADAYGMQLAFCQLMEAKAFDCAGADTVAMTFHATNTGDYNAVEALDALADIQVVLDGAVLTSGLQTVFHGALDEVFASNLTKTAVPYNEAVRDRAVYANAGTNVELFGGGAGEGAWILKRATDGKLMKPARFVAPSLHHFIL